MSVETIKKIQADLQEAGFYEGIVDGAWGPLSQKALDASLAASKLRCDAEIPALAPATKLGIAWSAKVSQKFIDRVIWISGALGMAREIGPDHLMACMAWESGETFSSSVKNGAGSGAVGLIQFMPATAKGMGTTTEALAALSPEDQLNYVYKYFVPYKGKLKNLGDLYMAILWPAGIGKADNWVLWNKDNRPTTYLQNKGLDVNKDGSITRGECLAKVNEKLTKGLLPQNRRMI